MKITEIVALVSAIAFTLTVAYTYGFSHSMEVNLIRYFSINDYLKLSVSWLPMSIISLGIGYCIAKTDHKLFGIGSSFEDKIAKYPNISSFGKFNLKHEETVLSVIVVVSYIGVLIFIAFRFAPEHLYHIFYCLLGIGLWIAFFYYLLKPALIKELVGYRLKALGIAPIIIIWVYISGLMFGISEIDKVEKHPTELLEITNKKTNKKGNILFALSQYVIFLDQKTKMVEIIPIGQVKNIIPIAEENKKKLEDGKK